MKILFQAKNVVVKKDLNILLDDINFSISSGELIVIIGNSGCGKTVLLRTITGEESLYSGSIEKDKNLKTIFVSQQDNFFSQTNMSLTYHSQRYEQTEELENIPLVKNWVEYEIEKSEVTDEKKVKVFSQLNVESLLFRNLLQLSNGERKRIQIALAILQDADIYVFDQPFLGLDADAREMVLLAMKNLKQNQKSIVLVSNPIFVPDFSDKILRMEAKTIVETLSYSELKSEQKQLDSSDLIIGELTQYKTQEFLQYKCIVSMKNVQVQMRGETLLKNINWKIKPHERWLLSGNNGSGKSTLLSLINADNPQAYNNDIELFDKKRGSGESVWEIKQKIGFVSPEFHLYFLRQNKLTVSSKVSLSDMTGLRVILSGFFDEIGFSSVETNLQHKIATEWLTALRLEHLMYKRFTEISLGEQRMLLLIRALVKNPPLLILDEPCQGIDYEQSQRFLKILDVICEKFDSTLIYVSHSSEEIPKCITHKIELHDGEIKSIGDYIK